MVTESSALPAIPAFEVREDHLWTEAVEINAAWHCNIRCESCSHGSPAMPTVFADASKVAKDLTSLARWMRTDHVRIVGGEPLIHPDIVGILLAIQSSGISLRTRIITNGLALLDQPTSFWSAVDEVHVSIYPNMKRFHARHRDVLIGIAEETETSLVFKYFDYFRKSFRPASDDSVLTDAIYRTCQIANRWRCLTVEDGYLFRCPQSALSTMQSGLIPAADGVEIQKIASREDLRQWTTSLIPLQACCGCSGSVGQLHPHRQLQRDGQGSLSADVDLGYLATLMKDPNAPNGCVTREEVFG